MSGNSYIGGTSVARSVPFDNTTNQFTATDVQVAIEEGNERSASAYGSGTYRIPNGGYSNRVPLGNTEWEKISTMHDPTVATSGTATGSQTSTTLQDTSKTWTTNAYATGVVRILTGTGAGQFRPITSNTSNTLTVSPAWTVTPVAGSSTYEVTMVSSRITVPNAGIYLCVGSASFAPSVLPTIYGVRFDVNGTFSATIFRNSVDTTESGIQLSRAFSLAANDYVEMQLYQQSTGDLTINSGASRLYLQVMRQ